MPVEVIENPTDLELRELYRNALCLVFPTIEDFGLVPVEAQAAGTPVVALGEGGALDTVVDGVSGILVDSCEPGQLAKGIVEVGSISSDAARKNAARFSKTAFTKAIQTGPAHRGALVSSTERVTVATAPKHAAPPRPLRVTTAAPLASSLLARLAQVAVLATVSHLRFHGVTAAVAGFGLVSSFAIITDSGFANYLLSTHAGTVPRQEYQQGLRYHAGLAVVGATAAVVSAAIIGRHELTPLVMELVIAFAVTQVGDSLSRTARAPYLSLTRPGRFSVPELASTLLKVPIIVLALVFRSPYWLLFLPQPRRWSRPWPSPRRTATSPTHETRPG